MTLNNSQILQMGRKICIEFMSNINMKISAPDKNWLLQAPNKDWIIPERYLVSFAMGGLAMTFFSDILIASGLRSRRHIFGSSISNLSAGEI